MEKRQSQQLKKKMTMFQVSTGAHWPLSSLTSAFKVELKKMHHTFSFEANFIIFFSQISNICGEYLGNNKLRIRVALPLFIL